MVELNNQYINIDDVSLPEELKRSKLTVKEQKGGYYMKNM